MKGNVIDLEHCNIIFKLSKISVVSSSYMLLILGIKNQRDY